MSLIIKHCYFIQIDRWLNRLKIFDGTDDMSMHIGEVNGDSKHRLTKSISSSGKSLFIDFKKEYHWGTVEVYAAIKYKKMNSVCQTWLDPENKILKTPNDFNTYNKSINCSWLVTGNFGTYIALGFTFFDVIFQCNFIYLRK